MEQPALNAVQHQLYELLSRLHQLGRDFPHYLIFLEEIVQPQLSEELRIPVLEKMFEEIPILLQQDPISFNRLVIDPPQEAVTLRLLLDFCELQNLIQQISYLQLLHLTNNLIPPGPPRQQLEFLARCQQIFQSWDKDILQHHHRILSETPLHLERQQLLQMEPSIPWELLHLVIELLKLPLEELYNLHTWITQITHRKLEYLIQLLQMEPAALLEIKQRLDTTSPTGDPLTGFVTAPTAHQSITDTSLYDLNQLTANTSSLVTTSRVSALASDMNLQLRVARQPPARTVYQRILKPFPAVMLVGGGTDMSNLFVEAALLRADSEVELPLCLEGNRTVRIGQGVFATFKKLKILSTSQQQGTLFRLRFMVKRYVGNVFEIITSATIISDPIEVFSHTLYLTEKIDGVAPPAPPVVNEILPPHGPAGTRVVVLGSNFVNSPNLRVRFGEFEMTPHFHEQGTLICSVPPIQMVSSLTVSVTNDGKNFCGSKVTFTLTG